MPTAKELLDSVQGSDDVAYLLSSDFRILSVNEGFWRFAQANGAIGLAESLGRQSIFVGVPQPLRDFYIGGFERARATGKPWEHEYECSSPERFRRFHMTVYWVEQDKYVVVHSRRIESAHSRLECAPSDARYVRDGVIKMCSHCRRVENPEGHESWDWVPDYVRQPTPRISHGLCPPCGAFYWGSW